VKRIAGVDGVELAVRRHEASGTPPFLLVHGLASNSLMWEGVAARLVARGHAAAAVDVRGHGLSERPDGGYDVVTISDDLRLVLDGLGWARAALVGQSWGASLVLEMAHRFPARAVGVACVDGGLGRLAARFGSWAECATALAPPRTIGQQAASIEEMLRAAHPDWPETGIAGAMGCFEVRADGTVAPRLTLERHLAILRHMWEHDPSLLYREMRVPVLFAPAASPSEEGWVALKRKAAEDALELVPDARVVWFEGADHDVHAQRPAELAAALIDCVTSGWWR